MSKPETDLVVVLNDGETFSNLEGCLIAAVPSDLEDTAAVEEFLKEDQGDTLPIGPITDTDTVMRWMRIFFPGMQVRQDNDGQTIIYTDIFEGEDQDETEQE